MPDVNECGKSDPNNTGFLQKRLSCFIPVYHVIWQITDFPYEPFKPQGTLEFKKPTKV